MIVFSPPDAGNQMKLLPTEGLQAAMIRFRETAFGENEHSLVRVPKPNASDFRTELLGIVLPSLGPPQAIRDKNAPSQDRIKALVDQLAAGGYIRMIHGCRCPTNARGIRVQRRLSGRCGVAIPTARGESIANGTT
jgi:hypothetical protein